jgi:hypothetical protein
VIVEATKRCGGKHGCGTVLPVSEFGYTKTGFRTECRACSVSAATRWREENPDRSRGTRAQWGQDNPITLKAGNLKTYAHRAGPSDIDIDWIMERLDRGVCELTGIPFVYEWRHPFLPSIDRIDATQPGHMKDNCRVVLWGLNAFKGTASEEVFLKCLAEVSATPNRSRQSL